MTDPSQKFVEKGKVKLIHKRDLPNREPPVDVKASKRFKQVPYYLKAMKSSTSKDTR